MDQNTIIYSLAGLIAVVTVGHIAVIISLARKLSNARNKIATMENELEGHRKAEKARRDHLKRIAPAGARAATAAKKGKKAKKKGGAA